MMMSEHVEGLLSRYVDGDLPPGERETVRAHLETCGACSSLAEDLTRVRNAARSLGALQPPDHVWLEIAGQIRLEAPPPAPPQPARRPQALRQWIGLAAALVIVTLLAYFVPRLGSPDAPAAETPAASDAGASVDAVAEEMQLAVEHFEKAIAELEALTASEGSDAIEPEVAETLKQNVDLIDMAIVESRAALASDPTSEPVRDTLLEALRRKVDVLQSTVRLINQMRQGDEQGAAATAQGLETKS
jgi:anti-sigma factor RsiW